MRTAQALCGAMCAMATLARRGAALAPRGASVRSLATYPLEDVIISPANEKVKLMKSLKLKKKREEHGLVLVEGFRLIQDSVAHGLQVESMFLTEAAAASPFGKELRFTLLQKQKGAPIALISKAVHSELTDTVHGQGAIAAFRKPVYPPGALLGRESIVSAASCSVAPLVVLLDGVSDPGNAGTLIRSCYGLGAQAVCAVDSVDLWAPKVLRSAMSASLRLPIYEPTWAELPPLLEELMRGRPFQVVIADGAPVHPDHRSVDFRQPTVLVVGSEAHGASAAARVLSTRTLLARVPMARPLESFNAAVAGSIMLAEAARQRTS